MPVLEQFVEVESGQAQMERRGYLTRETAFFEWLAQDYGRRQRQYRRHHKLAPVWRTRAGEVPSVTMDEVQGALRRSGLEIPPGTLRRWAAEGRIPGPRRVQNPDGRGRLSDWPEETPAEAGALFSLVRGRNPMGARWTMDDAIHARNLARRIMAGEVTLADLHVGKVEASASEFFAAQQWLLRFAAVSTGRLVDKPVSVSLSGGRMKAEESTADVLIG